MPVPDSDSLTERQAAAAAAALLAAYSPLASELSGLFAAAGHQLALVGGPVRDVFLGRRSGDEAWKSRIIRDKYNQSKSIIKSKKKLN